MVVVRSGARYNCSCSMGRWLSFELTLLYHDHIDQEYVFVIQLLIVKLIPTSTTNTFTTNIFAGSRATMENTASFGYWLRRRGTLDLTLEALAQRVGYPVATICKFERDQLRPSRQVRMADRVFSTRFQGARGLHQDSTGRTERRPYTPDLPVGG
jgi:hypothetical protein